MVKYEVEVEDLDIVVCVLGEMEEVGDVGDCDWGCRREGFILLWR